MTGHVKQTKGAEAFLRGFCAALLIFLLAPALLAFSPVPAWAALDVMGQDPCPDQVMAQSLRDAPKSAYLYQTAAANNVWSESLEAEQTSSAPQKDLHSMQPYCIDKIQGYFSVADALMDGAAWISNYIKNILTTLINAPCNYILSAVSSALSSALNAVCIPISLPSFSLTLPSSNGGKSCSGLSLADVAKVNIVPAARMAAPIPNNFLSAPMARFIDATGLGSATGSVGISNPIKF